MARPFSWRRGIVYLVPLCHEHNHYTFTEEDEVPKDMLLKVPEEDLKREILDE